MPLGDQFIDDAYTPLGRRVTPNKAPDSLESLLMRFEDNDPILDTSEKIATVGQAYFSAKCGRHNKPAIIRHFHMRLSHVSP
jgi:hypothetical protein